MARVLSNTAARLSGIVMGLAHGAGVEPDSLPDAVPPTSASRPLSSPPRACCSSLTFRLLSASLPTPGISGPQHHPPIHMPCTTTLLPATSPINIFRSPKCGFCHVGNVDKLCSKGECSEKGAPRLKVVMRRRDRVYMSVNEDVEVVESARERVDEGVEGVPGGLVMLRTRGRAGLRLSERRWNCRGNGIENCS